MLRSVVTDVSGQPIGSHLQGTSSARRMPRTQVPRYIVNGVDSDWFSENVTLAERVSGAWATRKQEGVD
jgi:hypothetical protein